MRIDIRRFNKLAAGTILLLLGTTLIGRAGHAQVIPDINSVSTRSITVLTNIGPIVPPVALPDPTVPSNLAAAPAGANFKLWIYDPRTRTGALGSPGIFIKTASTAYVFRSASTDGSLYLTLDPGSYLFDVVEPSTLSSTMVRKSYTATVTSTSTSVTDVTTDSRGYTAVTVTILNTVSQAAVARLTAIANESALTYNPKSACQLVDQITSTRSLSTDLSAGFPRVRTRLPSYGRIRALIVPIDFSDVPGTTSPVTVFTPIADGMRDFYYAQSYGRLAFDFSIASNWLRAPFTSTKHNMGGTVGAGDVSGYRRELIAVTDTLFDFNEYDAVYFLVPPSTPMASIGWGPAITSPLSTRNGYITNGATGGADMYLAGNGPNAARNWIAHETGHAFGIYDEDLDHASATLGNWSLMGNSWARSAIEHTAWDRYLLGWFGESQTRCLPKHTLTTAGTTLTLNPLVRQNTELKAAMVPLTPSKMLVIESRKNEGFDVLAADREGVLVYTVDMTLGQLKGGYRTQRRTGSTLSNFEDAALRAGDSITVEGVVVSVGQLSTNGDIVTVRAETAPVQPVLSVTRNGLGYGTVVSSPAGINCTPTCFAGFAANTNVTLTATAASGNVFTGWSGDCTGMGPCTVPMSAAKNVSATFYGQEVNATYNGLWWIPAESGWGMSLTQRSGIIFMAWYTYDASGAPVWYVMSNCAVAGNGCTGDLYSVAGGQPLTVAWTNPSLTVNRVGSGTFAFADGNNGTFTYTLNGVAGVKNITRQIFGSGTTAPAVDYTALWWASPAGTQSGWGVALTQQFNIIFVTVFTYDNTGKPVWYVASNCAVSGSSCTGALYRVTGGRMPTVAWGNPALGVAEVGSITIQFTNASSGTMNYTIDGVSGSRSVTKQVF